MKVVKKNPVPDAIKRRGQMIISMVCKGLVAEIYRDMKIRDKGKVLKAGA